MRSGGNAPDGADFAGPDWLAVAPPPPPPPCRRAQWGASSALLWGGGQVGGLCVAPSRLAASQTGWGKAHAMRTRSGTDHTGEAAREGA